jgi:hypothetical protein
VLTKEQVMHGVDDDLLDNIEIRKAGELRIPGCKFLHKVPTSISCQKVAILFSKMAMLFICSCSESCEDSNQVMENPV